jgi:hypothetical protein
MHMHNDRWRQAVPAHAAPLDALSEEIATQPFVSCCILTANAKLGDFEPLTISFK